MKKIDLHLHTQSLKTGDGSKRVIKPKNFVEKMRENNVKICSITNHNKFDLNEFNEINSLNEDLLIFPGIELDIKYSDGVVKHIIVISNPKKKDLFSSVFNDSKRNYETYTLGYTEFLDKVKKFDSKNIIIIPHTFYKEKDRGLDLNQIKQLKVDLMGYIIFLEPKDLRTMGIINSHNDLSLFGSDVKNWNNYPEKELPEIKFDVDSFEKFITLASDSTNFVKIFLNDASLFEINKSGPESQYSDLKNSIKIYNDINIIFGEKGSGKTVLIKDYIIPKISSEGKNYYFYEAKEYQNIYENLIKNITKNVIIDKDLFKDSLNLFKNIINYSEETPQDFIKKYKNHFENIQTNRKAKKIIKTEASYLSNEYLENSDELLIELKDNLKLVKKVELLNNETDEFSRDKQNLKTQLNLLKQDIYTNQSNLIKNNFYHNGLKLFLETLNSSIQKQTGIASKPINLGFSDLIAKRLARIQWNSKLLENLENRFNDEQIFDFGNLPNKGNIKIKASIMVMDQNTKFNQNLPFKKNDIESRRIIIRKIKEFNLENFSSVDSYFSPTEKQIEPSNFMKEVVKKHIEIVLMNEKERLVAYNPSEGEKAILSISGILENGQYEIFVFDEIERGLGNKYISTYLIPKIKSLRDSGKTLILSTHNANLAINTLPSQTIFCNYSNDDNKEYNYYEGNMYSNELRASDQDILKWEDVALINLEGKKEMFETRIDIYGI
ncbi:hypothetical protein [Globicatella sanguinis]|uniref:hypothetical protein n=1 Tax=Globicatella sanguinis TaxID=13076 RepID=UPI002543F3BE|nr:hypothetical protein [Globicatella sanguinis]MDK7631465.1 hypothetical protein [Globicatella sanguinis]WIK67065.1 hypothetical protein CYJ72_002950 [Globicatella sanguinis]WKT56470.1 hypothetical protein Q3C38_02950 [Globicatella sanguinis]